MIEIQENGLANNERNMELMEKYEKSRDTQFPKSMDNETKILKIIEINKKLGLENIENNFKHNNIIFVYSVPKVGSTSLVSSLKLFCFFGFVIIHIHSEIMLEIFSNIKNITVPELIKYNAVNLNRNVYVIDIYRSPIEHKISTYFEKIANYHFNTTNNKINNYDFNKITKRFNQLFPYLVNEDIFIDKYKIDEMFQFDFNKKYLFYIKENIKFLKLRLKDSKEWNEIFKKILNIDIVIIKDYTSTSKEFKILYQKFLENYKIPENFLNIITNDKYFNYYYSKEEKENYINKWVNKKTEFFQPMNENEYKLYNEISLENQINNFIDNNHYIYNGCVCRGCLLKRQNIIKKLLNNKEIDINKCKIYHENSNIELVNLKNKKIRNKLEHIKKRLK